MLVQHIQEGLSLGVRILNKLLKLVRKGIFNGAGKELQGTVTLLQGCFTRHPSSCVVSKCCQLSKPVNWGNAKQVDATPREGILTELRSFPSQAVLVEKAMQSRRS